MNRLSFFKYHGTGNDFVLIDHRAIQLNLEQKPEFVRHLCDRHFGIGADGLILIDEASGGGLEMIYFNADGNIGSMCGNGSRCFVQHLHAIGLIDQVLEFRAFDGIHAGRVLPDGQVAVQMRDIPLSGLGMQGEDYIIDTGSPHYVRFVDDLGNIDARAIGREVRNSPPFIEEGINVNFVQLMDDAICIQTYERGVEDLTLSCGTGVTAAALVTALRKDMNQGEVAVITDGGALRVQFLRSGDTLTNIWLIGPAKRVFQGEIALPPQD